MAGYLVDLWPSGIASRLLFVNCLNDLPFGVEYFVSDVCGRYFDACDDHKSCVLKINSVALFRDQRKDHLFSRVYFLNFVSPLSTRKLKGKWKNIRSWLAIFWSGSENISASWKTEGSRPIPSNLRELLKKAQGIVSVSTSRLLRDDRICGKVLCLRVLLWHCCTVAETDGCDQMQLVYLHAVSINSLWLCVPV